MLRFQYRFRRPQWSLEPSSTRDGSWVAAVDVLSQENRLALLVARVDRETGTSEVLTAPTAERSPYIAEPSFVTSPAGELREVLWLSGDSAATTALYAASWVGGWEDVVTLSPVGPGTQVALSSCALASGGGLAVWVAYDGSDDEVMWSRGGRGDWSEPAALSDNSVPDITPTLSCDAAGAVVAVWRLVRTEATTVS